MPTIFVTYNDVISFVKGYRVYKNVWKPRLQEKQHGEIEQNNPLDKYAVTIKIDRKIVEFLPLRKKGKFAKTIFHLIQADPYRKCDITATGKTLNLGDGDGMQVPGVLCLSGHKFMVEISKQQTSRK